MTFKEWPKNWPAYFNGCADPCDTANGHCCCGVFHNDQEFEFSGGTLYRFGKRVAGFKDEAEVKDEILAEYGHGDYLLYKLANGFARYGDGRGVRLGSVKGASDLFGGRRIRIKQEHVGREILQFMVIEVKGEGPDNTAKDRKEAQADYMNAVRRLGGIAGIARSTVDVSNLIAAWDYFEGG